MKKFTNDVLFCYSILGGFIFILGVVLLVADWIDGL
jgi:hypothetical protein